MPLAMNTWMTQKNIFLWIGWDIKLSEICEIPACAHVLGFFNFPGSQSIPQIQLYCFSPGSYQSILSKSQVSQVSCSSNYKLLFFPHPISHGQISQFWNLLRIKLLSWTFPGQSSDKCHLGTSYECNSMISRMSFCTRLDM